MQKYFLAALITAVIMGSSFLAAARLLDEVSSFQACFIRWGIGSITMCLLVFLRIVKVNFKGKKMRRVLTIALIQPCLYAMCEFRGIQLTTVAESAIILAMIPVMAVVISALFFRVKVGKATVIFVILAFAGVVMTADFSAGFGGKTIGYLILMGSTIMGAMYSILSERVKDEFSPVEITFVMNLSGGIWYGIICAFRGEFSDACIKLVSDYEMLASGLMLGVLAAAIAYILWAYALTGIPAHVCAVFIGNLVTVVGVIMGVVFRGDNLTILSTIGMILVIIGVIGVTLKQAKQPDSQCD